MTSSTYRFIIGELQTCFILHCSFAEVNSWEREEETGHRREVGNRGRTGSNGSNSLKWPFVYSLNPLNCVFKLAFTSQKGHRLRLVSERPIQCVLVGVFGRVLMSFSPITIIPSSPCQLTILWRLHYAIRLFSCGIIQTFRHSNFPEHSQDYPHSEH